MISQAVADARRVRKRLRRSEDTNERNGWTCRSRGGGGERSSSAKRRERWSVDVWVESGDAYRANTSTVRLNYGLCVSRESSERN
jgi:hypothetical protein